MLIKAWVIVRSAIEESCSLNRGKFIIEINTNKDLKKKKKVYYRNKYK